MIAINVAGVNSGIELGTEFASITLMSSRNYLPEFCSCNTIFRPMICRIMEFREALARMKIYQPEICNVSRVFFSGIFAEDSMALNDALCESFLKNLPRQDLKMVVGNMTNEHLGFAVPFSLYCADVAKESVLIICKLKEKYVLNVVGPVSKSREAEI